MFCAQLSACSINIISMFLTQCCFNTMLHQNIIEMKCLLFIDAAISVLIHFIVWNQIDIGIHTTDQIRQLYGMGIRIIDTA